jgi:hypothetical protein
MVTLFFSPKFWPFLSGSKVIKCIYFAGSTPDNEIFFVQIKEDVKTKQKYFISVFPLGG